MNIIRFRLLAVLLISIIIISGCTTFLPESGPVTGGEEGAAETPSEERELTTAITPARDLTGDWEGLSGSAKWRNNVGNPACSYEGFFGFSFEQDGNTLTGTFTSIITNIIPAEWNQGEVPCGATGAQPSFPLTGTVSSSRAEFTVADIIKFSSSFTTDLMQGTFESCSNQICSDGTRAVGAIGEFKVMRQG